SFQCLPHCMQSALFPVVQQIQRRARLKAEDSDEAKLHKLEKLLSLATEQLEKTVPFVAEMMSIPIGSRYRLPALTAQQMNSHTLFVLVELLVSLASEQPVLCLLEDAQWIDPSSQELLDLVVGRIDRARILLVVTHRPEYQVHSPGNVSGLTLTRLKRHDTTQMARLALGNRAVSTAAMDRIIEESDSIPLFVEELAHGTIERDATSPSGVNDGHRQPSDSLLVPASLRDSLAARLDRAPKARNVAQMAAVIGREFSYDMLLGVASPSLSPAELDSTLAHLRKNEIVQLIDDGPPARWAFKHALLRDAAYESLLRSSRREIHTRIASTI